MPVLFYAVIRFWPTLQAFYLSVTDWSVMRPASFVGLDNYRRLAGDPLFWQVFRNTFAYLLIGTPISLILSFVIAYYLDRVRFLHGLIRALYFLPFLTTAAMAWVWRWFPQPVPMASPTALYRRWASRSSLSCVRRRRPCRPCLPAIWAGLGSEPSSSSRDCAPSRQPITRPRASTDFGGSDPAPVTLPGPADSVFLVVFSSIGFCEFLDQVFNIVTNDRGGPLNATKPWS